MSQSTNRVPVGADRLNTVDAGDYGGIPYPLLLERLWHSMTKQRNNVSTPAVNLAAFDTGTTEILPNRNRRGRGEPDNIHGRSAIAACSVPELTALILAPTFHSAARGDDASMRAIHGDRVHGLRVGTRASTRARD